MSHLHQPVSQKGINSMSQTFFLSDMTSKGLKDTVTITGENLWDALASRGPADIFLNLKDNPKRIIDRAYVYKYAGDLCLTVYIRESANSLPNVHTATIIANNEKLAFDDIVKMTEGAASGLSAGAFILPWEDYEAGIKSLDRRLVDPMEQIGRVLGLAENLTRFFSDTSTETPAYRSWARYTYPNHGPETMDIEILREEWFLKSYILDSSLRLLVAHIHTNDRLANALLGKYVDTVTELTNHFLYNGGLGELPLNLTDTNAPFERYMVDNYFYHIRKVTAMNFFRAKAGMTFENLAKETGLSLSQLKQYETAPGSTLGRARPATLKKLAQALNISISDIVVNNKPVMRFPA